MKPKALAVGDTVGLVSPAGVTYETVQIEIIEETLDVLGLKMKAGEHMMNRWGYFAGTDEERATDINTMFSDDSVDAIFALHGGWGSARIIEKIDYGLIRKNPKIFMGYSDVTALLLALYAQTGLITFHGPNGNSVWNPFAAQYLDALVFKGDQVLYKNPKTEGQGLVPIENRTRTITTGKARGRLVGGNLTVLTAMLGSPRMPEWSGHILFLEDIGEAVYRVDRMMTQLKLAGVLDQISGFVFGACTDCKADSGYNSFTLSEVIDQHIKPLGIPAYAGAMIGHIKDKFTIPIGIEAEIDAENGTIQLLEAAVENRE
ncbi:MAG: LD-carboxypeptidase [Bacteroidota bacterium]